MLPGDTFLLIIVLVLILRIATRRQICGVSILGGGAAELQVGSKECLDGVEGASEGDLGGGSATLWGDEDEFYIENGAVAQGRGRRTTGFLA